MCVLTIGWSDYGGVFGEPRRQVDGLDKSTSFFVGATPRRSTSSLDEMPSPASISAAQIQVYAEFDGDADMYQRCGMPNSGALGDIWSAWGAIEDLRRRLYLVAVGRASVQFAASAEADLFGWAADEETRRQLRAIVDRDTRFKSSAIV